MHKQLIEKPLIIAICGKSAAGKDTLASFLTKYFASLGLHTHKMISVTTRFPRVGEINGKDYFFVNKDQFAALMEDRQLIEHTHFNNQFYGVPYKEAKSGYINIGVFNPEGLNTLKRLKLDYWIVPVYIKEKLSTRLMRSYDREGRWKIEFFRRAFVDHFDFKNIEDLLIRFRGRYVVLDNIGSTWKQANIIERCMYKWGLFIKDSNNIVRLGNFV